MDTSALVEVFLMRRNHEVLTDVIDLADAAALSVVSRVELTAVLCGHRFGLSADNVASFLDGLHLEHIPVSLGQMDLAVAALITFGKGRHPAGLNLGDCFSYALAKELGANLLFVGDDFSKTDIGPAWRPSA